MFDIKYSEEELHIKRWREKDERGVIRLRIAICDDSPQDIAAISRCINRITEYAFEYDIFHEPTELIKFSVEQQIHYDLYIFDIEMPQMNGIDLAA